jgi:hypothetical protein
MWLSHHGFNPFKRIAKDCNNKSSMIDWLSNFFILKPVLISSQCPLYGDGMVEAFVEVTISIARDSE